MWKKLAGRPRDNEVNSPTTIEQYQDEGYLETIPEVDSLRSAHSSVRQQPSLPELPLYVNSVQESHGN